MKNIKENWFNLILVAILIWIFYVLKEQITLVLYYAKSIQDFKFIFPFVNNQITNDTFFTIAIGNNILQNGIQNTEILTWHEGLSFANPRWLFDIFIAFLYGKIGFERNIFLYNNNVNYIVSCNIFCFI